MNVSLRQGTRFLFSLFYQENGGVTMAFAKNLQKRLSASAGRGCKKNSFFRLTAGGFVAIILKLYDSLAQLAEHLTFNQGVRSSNLRWITICNLHWRQCRLTGVYAGKTKSLRNTPYKIKALCFVSRYYGLAESLSNYWGIAKR